MRDRYFLSALFLVTACSSLPTTGDGIVALEVIGSKTLVLDPTDSLLLRARALNQQGDSVLAAIRWYTVDTVAISLDSITGRVYPLVQTGSARVQAGVGTLRSDLITITIKVP